MRPRAALRRFARDFARDRRGVSAIEFALIAPFLIALYMGMAELSQGMSAQRRASHAASVIGDLIAQSDNLPAADVDKALDAATIVMKPFPTTSLKVRITSVTADFNGNPKSVWSRGKNGLAAYGNGAAVSVPTGLLSAGDNLLLAESAYTYSSPVTTVLPNALVFSEKFYLKARKGSAVVCTGC